MNDEVWVKVKGFPNYEISSYGNLRRVLSEFEYRNLSSNIKDKDGYIKTSMYKYRKRYYLRMHRIVTENFIPNPDNKPVVNHINGVKDDNRVENLEWSTVSENAVHSFKYLGRKGHHGNTNIKVRVIYDNGNEILFDSQTACSEYLKIHLSTVSENSRLSKRPKGKDYIIVRDYEGVTTIESIL